MHKKHLLPALPLALAAILAPQALWAQDEYGPVPSGANMSLDTMVVTATRTAESMREVTTNTTVITAEQINNSTARSLDEILVQQGFQVMNDGATKRLRIRGMGQNQMSNELESNVLVLLNGRRLGANNVAIMGLDNIERVEIIRGPSAVQFGSSAMGGVVNVITKRGVPGETEIGVEAGIGSYDLYKGILSLSGGVGGFDFSGSVTNWSRDNYDVSGGHEWKYTSIDSSTSMNLDLGYNFFEKHRLGLNLNYYDQNDSQFPGSGWANTGRPSSPSYGDYGNYDFSNYNLAFLYEGATDDDRFNWFARYSFGKDEIKRVNHSVSWGDSYGREEMDNKSAAAQIAYSEDIFSVALGLDYIKYDYTTLEIDSSQNNMAGYLSAKLRLLDEMLIISAGGRYDHFKNEVAGLGSSSDDNFAPSIGLAVLPNDWLKLRANYSEGFKIASPRQTVGYRGAWGSWIPNHNLDPETSKTFEIGADVSCEYLDASLTYFHTNWDNKIVSLGTGVPNQYQYQNLKGATIEGLELAFGVNIGQAFDWEVDLRPYINLTYLMTRENKDRTGGGGSVQAVRSNTLPNTPEYTISYGLNFAYPVYDFKANINAVYSGETLTQDWRTLSPTNGRYIKHSGGTVVDLHLEKSLITFDNCSKLSLKVDVKNLFDSDNDAYLDYPGPGRNFYVGLRYDY
jgi:Outer membrane receptor for ferrienterochelin and colicins